MSLSTPDDRRRFESMPRERLREYQLARLNQLLDRCVVENPFYARKLAGVPPQLASWDEFAQLPFTTKDELVSGADRLGRAANHTWPAERYLRWHQTSGTRGRPLVMLDTADDWQWWLDLWQYVLDAADVRPSDTVFLAFSFGPFIGFWSACDAALRRGCLVVPGGGMTSVARLELLRSSRARVLCCTPTYAQHLANVAGERGWRLSDWFVRRIVVAGEPGGSLPSLRERLEREWGAVVIDHAGATEVGPWGYADADRRGLHIPENEFIAEFLDLTTGQPAAEGGLSELVLTNLGRHGCPVIRYRTGDLVRPRWNHAGANRFVLLEGGVLGRLDDMLVIRGVNVFPTAIEEILREFPQVAEYRLIATRVGALDALQIELELPGGDKGSDLPDRVAQEVQTRLGLRVDVSSVPVGSLPRTEGKSRRFVDRRGAAIDS